MYFGDYSETKARYLITKYGGTSLNEWMMTNQFYDILLSNGFYTDLEAYKADPANRPLIDENTGEWIDPGYFGITLKFEQYEKIDLFYIRITRGFVLR